MAISQAEIDAFHQQGYLVIRKAIGVEALTPLISDLSELIDEIAHRMLRDGSIPSLFEQEPFERRIASISAASGQSIQNQISFPVNLRWPLFKFLHTPRLLDTIESLVGPEIYCNPTHHIRPKLPESVGRDDWVQQSPVHQDAAVFITRGG